MICTPNQEEPVARGMLHACDSDVHTESGGIPKEKGHLEDLGQMGGQY